MAKTGRRCRTIPFMILALFLFSSVTSTANKIDNHDNEIETHLDSELDQIFAPEEKEFGEQIVTCEKPEAPENGYIEGNGDSIGAQLFIRCNHGYRLIGSSAIQCLAVPDPFKRVAIWDPTGERKCVEVAFESEIDEDEELNSQLWNPEEDPNSNHGGGALINGRGLINHNIISSQLEVREIRTQQFNEGEEIEYSEADEQEHPGTLLSHDSVSHPVLFDELFAITKDEHSTHKVARELPELCSLPSESGPCKALFWRFHYNMETGQCEQFAYGGCMGNENNFEDKEKCESVCAQ